MRAPRQLGLGRVGIHLFGARNEILAFQVVVEADERGIRALSVRCPNCGRHPTRSSTARPPPIRPIRWTGPSSSSPSTTCTWRRRPARVGVEPGSPAAPSDPTGWKPVQLVPENARRDAAAFRWQSSRGRTRRSGSRFTPAAPRGRVYRPRHRDVRMVTGRTAGRARGVRFRPAGREQHARDAVLLERRARAVPRAQHGRRVSPLRAPAPRRAGARLRRSPLRAPRSAVSPARTSAASPV